MSFSLAQDQLQFGCRLQENLQALHEARTLRKVRSESDACVDLQGIRIVGYLNVLYNLVQILHRCGSELQEIPINMW